MHRVKIFYGYAVRTVGVALLILGVLQALVAFGPQDPLVEIQSHGFPTVESWMWDVISRGMLLFFVGAILFLLSSPLLAKPVISIPKSFKDFRKEVMKGGYYAVLIIGGVLLGYLSLIAFFSIMEN
jgi:energy-converting hydrogenase Eha subunit E